MTQVLSRISAAGLSIWLDDLSRERFQGSLQRLIDTRHVVGVTTNPAIFSAAISRSDLYDDDLQALGRKGLSASAAIRDLTISDVRNASQLFAPIFDRSHGVDGRISIEVDPELAHDAAATIAEGISLWQEVNRPNILIKVPATREGLVAIEELTYRGISINVTLIFTAARYDRVIDSYFSGLERRVKEGLAIGDIHSVASFFVSRIDTEIDARLRSIAESGDEQLFTDLRGRAGVANALNAYRLFLDRFASERWQRLQSVGGNLQRPLWASTGVKDPAYSPTLYVESLITKDSVNTMPEATLDATASLPSEHQVDVVDGPSPRFEEAQEHLRRLAEIGIEIEAVGDQLEIEGVEKFVTPWRSLHENVASRILA